MKHRKPPNIDVDATPSQWIEAVEAHPGYQAIRERMQSIIDKSVEELVKPQTAERTAELRGVIGAVRLCLLVPAILRKELEKKELAR